MCLKLAKEISALKEYTFPWNSMSITKKTSWWFYSGPQEKFLALKVIQNCNSDKFRN